MEEFLFHFCCTDSLFMTHRGELSLSIIIWRIGGGDQVSLCPGAQKTKNYSQIILSTTKYKTYLH
jgi:hypothetical protein